ncbi:hypothetical protein ABT324_07260 [Saccharopolyspora sp. NPDC000359]|uniref:hypothetical protein n=1 Tax=Saccharopolyspora sp. NPDC000359 TaxID=3154251 RepID=UPI00332EEE20
MLGYRSVFQVEQGSIDVLARVREQLHSWLRRKHYDSDAVKPDALVSLGPNADGVLLEKAGKDGSNALRVRVTEKQPGGIWTSQLTVHVPGSGDPAMVWVDIVNPEVLSDDADQPARRRQWTATPKLVRDLLTVLPAADGTARLDSRPWRVSGEDAEDLVGIIRDPSRRGPVYVVGSQESLPQGPWFDLARRLLYETVGIGAGYLLDPEATRVFARAVGESHEVKPGTMRTFLPGAEPGDTTDALRHRVLSTGRILKDEQPRLPRLLGWRARDIVIEQRLPNTAVRLDRQFEKQLDQLLVEGEASDAASVAPRVDEASPSILDRDVAIVQVLREELDESELTADRLRELVAFARIGQREQVKRQGLTDRFEELQERTAELQQSLDEVSEQLDDETLELAEANADLAKERPSPGISVVCSKWSADTRTPGRNRPKPSTSCRTPSWTCCR